MNKPSKQLLTILHGLLMLLWVLNGGSVLAAVERNTVYIAFIVVLMLLFVLRQPKLKQSVVTALGYSLIIVIICLCIVYIFSIKPQDIMQYIFQLIQFFIQGMFCVYIFSVFTYQKFIKIFYRLLIFVRLHAFVSAILFLILPFLFSINMGNDFTGFQARSFLYLFYMRADEYSFSLFGIPFTRNQGLFWEPGVLQFYLNLFLYFQLYVFKTKNFYILLTIATIISTYSTTAYGIMIIVLFGFLIRRIKKNPILILPIILVGALLFVPLLQANLENKFEGEHQTSSAVRLYDLVQQIFVIKDNFFTGVGIDDQQYMRIRVKYGLPEYLQSILGYNELERGSSNSILFILATMGVFIGGLWIYAYTKQCLIKEKRGLLTFLLVIGVMAEPLLLKPFFITFIISGLMILAAKFQRKGKQSLWQGSNLDLTAINPASISKT